MGDVDVFIGYFDETVEYQLVHGCDLVIQKKGDPDRRPAQGRNNHILDDLMPAESYIPQIIEKVLQGAWLLTQEGSLQLLQRVVRRLVDIECAHALTHDVGSGGGVEEKMARLDDNRWAGQLGD